MEAVFFSQVRTLYYAMMETEDHKYEKIAPPSLRKRRLGHLGTLQRTATRALAYIPEPALCACGSLGKIHCCLGSGSGLKRRLEQARMPASISSYSCR